MRVPLATAIITRDPTEMIDFFKDFYGFIRERKKYYLFPVIIILIMLGTLVVLTEGSALAPFIYALF